MKKTILIISAGILVVLIAAFAFGKGNDSRQIASPENKKYQAQTDSQASVTVDAIPKQLGIEEKQNIFRVALNTHSVELDYNFTEVIFLKDDLGNSYQAIEWTGGSGWHHLNGDIIFPAIDQQAASVELEILGVGGVNRVFNWDL